MTEIEFIDYWNKHYSDSLPINHELKTVYPERWFRIHSLPESKRYAETTEEYKIILDRQNQLIDDLIGNESEVIISFGLYEVGKSNEKYKEQTDFGEFTKILRIDLRKERPEEFEEFEDEMFYDIYVNIEKWINVSRDKILKAIADDEIRAMLICPAKNCIIAPYDGGVDVIVDSTEKRDRLKVKYNDWLSEREDGI